MSAIEIILVFVILICTIISFHQVLGIMEIRRKYFGISKKRKNKVQ